MVGRKLIEAILLFLKSYSAELGGAAGLTAVVEYFLKPIRTLLGRRKKPDPLTVVKQTVEALSARQSKDGPQLTVPEFIRIRREMKADLEAELTAADQSEKDQLRARIAELEKQIADPEPALAEAQTRIADLEALLERSGNDIGGDRLAKARAALERGDFSIADEIFAEIEVRRELEVKEAARAAYGRGEIAEEQVRWHDAAEHYTRAARLDPSYDSLNKAGNLLWRAGQYADAIRHQEELMQLSKFEFGGDHKRTATALNNLASSYKAKGRFTEAEPLHREALEIERKTLGADHPSYAIHLNNLAGLLRATGRLDEAEPLYRKALEIDRMTLGLGHPDYAVHLSNLAELLRATGRLDEAEPLYREALEIDRKTLGADHPDYAAHLNNLAELLWATGRHDEAEPMYREAQEIFERVLGAEHPNTVTARKNLEIFLANRPK